MPWAVSGMSTFLRGLPCADVVGADHHQAAELAVRAGGRREGGGVHAGDLGERPLQLVHELERALARARPGRSGWSVGEAGQARQGLARLRVVLHGAGAERVEPGVDAVVPGREAGEVAHHLQLGELRQPLHLAAQQRRRQVARPGRRRRGPAGRRRSAPSSRARRPAAPRRTRPRVHRAARAPGDVGRGRAALPLHAGLPAGRVGSRLPSPPARRARSARGCGARWRRRAARPSPGGRPGTSAPSGAPATMPRLASRATTASASPTSKASR